MSENKINIGGRLHSIATGNVVAGADEILDDIQNKKQQEINSELIEAASTVNSRIAAAVDVEKTRAEEAEEVLDGRVDTLEEAVGTGGSIDARIEAAVGVETQRATEAENARYTKEETYSKEEADAAISGAIEDCAYLGDDDGQAVIPDFDPQADALWKGEQILSNAEKAQVKENLGLDDDLENIEGEISTLGATVSGHTTAIELLQELYRGLSQSDIVVVDDHTAVVSPEENTIYREPGDSSYTDWMYYNGSWEEMATYNNAVDDKPTASSNNLVKSGGVYDELALGAVFDVTAHNSNTTFASLDALLSNANLSTLIPAAVRKGGMSIKFVLTSSNKYVQYRYLLKYENTTAGNNNFLNIDNWQGVTSEVKAGSNDLVESGGVEEYAREVDDANADKFSTLGLVINKGTEKASSTIARSYMLATTGAISTVGDDNMYCIVYQLSKGDKVYISGDCGTTSFTTVAIFKSEPSLGSIPSVILHNGNAMNSVYVCPSNCYFVTWHRSSTKFIKLYNYTCENSTIKYVDDSVWQRTSANACIESTKYLRSFLYGQDELLFLRGEAITKTGTLYNFYINSEGKFTALSSSSNTTNVDYYAISKGDMVLINGNISTGYTNPVAAFSKDIPVSGEQSFYFDFYASPKISELFIAPSDGYLFMQVRNLTYNQLISVYNVLESNVNILTLKHDIEDIYENLEAPSEEITNYSTLSQTYITTTKFAEGSAGQDVNYIQVTKGERYYLSDLGHRVDSNNANIMLAVFSENLPTINGEFTSAIKNAVGEIDMYWDAPANGYLCFWKRNASKYVSVYDVEDFERISNIEKRLDNIGDISVPPLDVSDFYMFYYKLGSCTLKESDENSVTVNSGTAIQNFNIGCRFPSQAGVVAGKRLRMVLSVDVPSDLREYASLALSGGSSNTIHYSNYDKENGIVTIELTPTKNADQSNFFIKINAGDDNIFNIEHTFTVNSINVIGVEYIESVSHYSEVQHNGKRGLKMSCVGDSYTLSNTGDANFPHQWERVVKYYLGLDSFEVKAVHGGVLTTGGYLEITEIQEDADIITFWYGTNDYAGSKPLGTINDSAVSPTTFYGALKYVFDWISTNRPNAIFVPITHTRRYASTTDIDFINTNGRGTNGEPLNNVGKTLGDYTQAIKDVAMLYAYDVLDLHDISGVNENNESTFYSSDHLHPSPTSITKIGEKIARFISKSEIR